MKKRILVTIIVILSIPLINFILFMVNFGAASVKVPSIQEKFSAVLSNPGYLFNPLMTIYMAFFVIGRHIFLFFIFIILVAVAYYLYDNFIKHKKDIVTTIPETKSESNITSEVDSTDSKIEFFDNVGDQNNSLEKNHSNRGLKKVILGITVALIIFFAFLLILTSGSKPGEYVGLGMLLLPFMPIIWIFYPVYFIILALRYSREKSAMDPLDKIMFYILLVGIGMVFLLSLSKL